MAGMHVIDVDELDFEREVLERSSQVPVVVDFWADWCQPCRILGPVLEKLAEEHGGDFVLAKVDTQRNQRLAQAMRIQGIPAVKAFVDGKIVDEFQGALPEYAVKSWLEKLLPSEADKALAAAQARAAGGDDEGAVDALRDVLAADPEHAESRAALARALLQRGDTDGARSVVEEASERAWGVTNGVLESAWLALIAGDCDPRADGIEGEFATALLAAGERDFGAALDGLLQIVAKDRSWRDDLARIAMVRLFAILGDEHPLTGTYRQKMGAVMYV